MFLYVMLLALFLLCVSIAKDSLYFFDLSRFDKISSFVATTCPNNDDASNRYLTRKLYECDEVFETVDDYYKKGGSCIDAIETDTDYRKYVQYYYHERRGHGRRRRPSFR